MTATNARRNERLNQVRMARVAANARMVLSLIGPTNGRISQTPLIHDQSSLSHHPYEGIGGELEGSGGRPEVQFVELVLNGPLQDRRAKLVLREVGVEQQPIVADLVPLAMVAALAHAFVEPGPGQRIGDRVADVVERQAAGEVDALDQRVRRLAEVADHEK